MKIELDLTEEETKMLVMILQRADMEGMWGNLEPYDLIAKVIRQIHKVD